MDDASAFLARLSFNDLSAEIDLAALMQWLSAWRDSGGTRATLSLAVEALLAQQLQHEDLQGTELVWSGPDWGAGARMRDQSVLIQQLVEQAEQRLLITTYAFYKGPFVARLFEQIKACMDKKPQLKVRLVCNIARRRGDGSLPEALVAHFREKTWNKLWQSKPDGISPDVYYDPRSVQLDAVAVCHVKAVVSDNQLLVTSANITDAAQLHNFELGVRMTSKLHSDATWQHFDQLIGQGMLTPLIEKSTDNC
ncbi:hypothetical protein KBY58_04505 [Cyanobium sp. HWJ4-Hawea]|uniref:phospholipase D-like domain-containing protein n=1 Tax=Cyanobium sp. HWJ4-Hawea TaxID=2823713 RepID=UPI0020CEE7A2|nr:phospholipase D-like domain-containing protein [Cyanobium sp. HWJ4-Hawea]MCP9808691.1 hypothetical protein [Cyanobium sp. HWJ4-Hawea]